MNPVVFPDHVARGLLFSMVSLAWVIPAAIQDWRSGQVSNYLTLGGLLASLAIYLAGWSDAQWWGVLLMVVLVLLLWHYGHLGGADAKGWIAFALLGQTLLLAALSGMLFWFILIRGKVVTPPHERAPGYPGYVIGLFLVFSVVMVQATNLVLANSAY